MSTNNDHAGLHTDCCSCGTPWEIDYLLERIRLRSLVGAGFLILEASDGTLVLARCPRCQLSDIVPLELPPPAPSTGTWATATDRASREIRQHTSPIWRKRWMSARL